MRLRVGVRKDGFKLSERISLALAADDQAELSACLHECRHLITRTEMVRRMAQPRGEAPGEG